MEITCPNCSAINISQKFCGNCGTKLINGEISKPASVKKKRVWLKAVGLFFAIYIAGSVILGFSTYELGLNDKYTGGIIFVVDIIITSYYVTVKKDEQLEEIENDQQNTIT